MDSWFYGTYSHDNKIPDTFERLAWKMVSYIPKGYGHIDFVADCYFENSVKASERLKRGISNKVIVKSKNSIVKKNSYINSYIK